MILFQFIRVKCTHIFTTIGSRVYIPFYTSKDVFSPSLGCNIIATAYPIKKFQLSKSNESMKNINDKTSSIIMEHPLEQGTSKSNFNLVSSLFAVIRDEIYFIVNHYKSQEIMRASSIEQIISFE